MPKLEKLDNSTRFESGGGLIPFPVPHNDSDIEFSLDKAEVNTLNSDATRAAISAFLVANAGPLGVILAVYVNERINQIVGASGPEGSYVKTTIRDGTSLHVFQVLPLPLPKKSGSGGGGGGGKGSKKPTHPQ